MALAWTILGWTAFGAAVAMGFVLDAVGLFGNWIIFAALAVLWMVKGFACFPIWLMPVLIGLAVLGEVLEMAAAGYGARRWGGGREAMLGAVLGCLAGAMLGTPMLPVLGTMAGACVGAFAGAAACELLLMRKSADAALRTGFGAAVGKIGGIAAKCAVGFTMLVIAFFVYRGTPGST